MEKSSKEELPVPVGSSQRRRASCLPLYARVLFGSVLILLGLNRGFGFNFVADSTHSGISHLERTAQCVQLDPLLPSKHSELSEKLTKIYEEKDYPAAAAELLGGAIRIPTESYDDYGEADDPRWEKFFKFHDYLQETFPEVHSKLKLTKVNTYGLVYYWAGTDASQKALMLTAHQDVVPILPVTLSQWIHPPFSGLYDGTWLHGRGSVDQKSGVIGILIAVETLLKQDFKPSRSVILAFGFDEEISGHRGAQFMSHYLLDTYGEDSVALLVDEGGATVEQGGTLFAVPSVGEKGYTDVRIEVVTKGGHSSVPPEHTGIGHLASLITTLEGNPFPLPLTRSNPYYSELQCYAAYGGLSDSLADDIQESVDDDDALKRVESALGATVNGRVRMGTTQAVDIVSGGVKVNALPEKVFAVVNHRISVDSSYAELTERYVDLLEPYAASQNLSFAAFGKNVSTPQEPAGAVTISLAFGNVLEPAPVSPHAKGDPAWDVLAGTIRAVHKGSVVAPGLMTGNTDTRYYWKLSRAIYRYAGFKLSDSFNGGHTINEGIRATGFVDRIKLFTGLILNADEASL